MKSYKHKKAERQSFRRWIETGGVDQTKSPDLATLKSGELIRSDKKVMNHTSKSRKPSLPKMPWS